ncbi:MAG: nucleotidyltransferase domain-containing protein [Candidatus Paceibacterota bacterium]
MKFDKNNLEEHLNKFFQEYEKDGLLSAYLWGSITTGEFDIETSDIDIIAIVKSENSIDQSSIKEKINECFDDFKYFGFNVIREDELKEGVGKDSSITTVIHPRILLSDMKDWKQVFGKIYSTEDFTNNPAIPDELISLEIKKIIRDQWDDSTNVGDGFVQYHLKGIMRIIYYSQLKRNEHFPFSYTNIKQKANEEESQLIDIFYKNKDAGYCKQHLLENKDKVDSYTKKMIQEFIK